MTTLTQSKAYPQVPNFDNRIIPLEETSYHVFDLSEAFQYHLLYNRAQRVQKRGSILQLNNGQLFIDDVPFNGSNHPEGTIVKSNRDLEIIMTNLPKRRAYIGNIEKAAIAINSPSTASLVPTLDADKEVVNYQLFLRSNGERVYFNGEKIDRLDTTFTIGDQMIIGGVSIEYRPKQLKITSITAPIKLHYKQLIEQPLKPEYPLDFPEYRRSPRIIKVPPTEEITINKPRGVTEAPKGALARTILPPIMTIATGALMTLTMGRNIIMLIGTAATGLLTAAITVSAYFARKKEVAQKNEEREIDYDIYLTNLQGRLNALENKYRETLTHHFPDMESITKMMFEYNPRIYEKTPANADFLEVSLGMGDKEPSYTINFKEVDEKDELVVRANEIAAHYQKLTHVQQPIKLVGETLGFEGIYPVLKTAVQTLLFQIACFHSYKNVEFIALVPEEHYEADFKIWRWLPHFKMQALNLRGLIHHERSRDMVLNSFYQLITKRKQEVKESGTQESIRFSPHYVLTILDDTYLQGHGINEYLAEDMSQYGVTVIWCKESRAMLPETVTTMVSYFSSASGELVNESNIYQARKFTPYQLPKKEDLDLAIRRLANLDHVEVEKNAIPKMVTFLDMYKVKKVEELGVHGRWEKANTAKTLAVPLGLRGKDDLVELNLHERAHGPHGLVAGTTGSGKSEIVQSYVLSLAVNFSPEDVGFLPIDFKGGGMVNEFKNLPHLMGAITNLDGAASARALASIKAELRKRQAMFSKYGVNHINGYTKLYKRGKIETDPKEKEALPEKPIPHLFLISDEFAELKANEPEFMAELVSVARIGRSLGVHLILATQKPSGVVDDQIWSNSRFKLALKVADVSDSNEIIKTPDAAAITEPGRAYLQVGNNEIYELFQSAWSGPDYEPDKVVENKIDTRIWLINDLGQYELLTQDDSEIEDEASKKDDDLPTELHATVDHIAQVAEATNAIIPDKPWLPPLEVECVAPTIDREVEWEADRSLEIELGMLDIPDEQDQRPFMYDLEEMSHTAIYGSAGFGKSTVLQSIVMNLARSNSPSQVNFNLFDLGTNGLLSLKDLPHTADLVRLEDEEKLVKFLNILKAEIARRKELFLEASVGSLSQYEQKTGDQLPVIVNLIDAWDSLKDNALDDPVQEVITQLIRDGANVGMYVIITALRPNSIRSNLSSNIPTKIGLFMNDETDITDVVGREKLPVEEIAGRAQIKLDLPRSLHINLPTEGEDDLDRLTNLTTEVEEMNNAWQGDRPKGVPMLPNVIDLEWFKANKDVQAWIKDGNIPLAFSKTSTEPRGYRTKVDPYFLIANADMSQTEYMTETIETVFTRLNGAYNRVVFDTDGSYEDQTNIFDEVHPLEKSQDVMTSIVSYVTDKSQSDVEEAAKKAAEQAPTDPDNPFARKGPKKPYVPYKPKFNFMADMELEEDEGAADQVESTDEVTIKIAETDEMIVEQVEAEENPLSEIVLEVTAFAEAPPSPLEQEEPEVEEAAEKVEIKTPMLVYVPNFETFSSEVKLSDADVKALMKKAKDAGIYFIFQSSSTNINSSRTALGKYMAEMTRTGFVGQRSVDQSFITVKRNYSEPQMADGEHSYFDKKKIERVRTIGMDE